MSERRRFSLPEFKRSGSLGLIHPYTLRKLTIAEIKALASYPEAFQFPGSYRDRWARIGNSVPPLFMRAIAEHLRRNALRADTPSRGATVAWPTRAKARAACPVRMRLFPVGAG